MHSSVMAYAAAQARVWNREGVRVLEVGSYNVNGSARPLFDRTEYLGVDIRPGPGVDHVVMSGERYWGPPFLHLDPPRDVIDLVLCLEMLEHDERPWRSIENMAEVLRPLGELVVTARGFRYGQHDHPRDYWRFSRGSMRLLLEDAGLEVVDLRDDPDPASPGVFAIGRR